MTTPTPDREALARIVQIIERNTRRGRNGAYVTDIPKLADAILASADQWLARSSGGGEVNGKLGEAIRWALGEDVPGPEFEQRHDGEPAFWWRKELRRRMDEALAALPPPAPSGAEKIMAGLKEAVAIAQGEDQPGRVHVIKVGAEPRGCPMPGACSCPAALSPNARAKIICEFMGWPEDGPAWTDAHKLAASLAAPAPLPSGVVELKEASTASVMHLEAASEQFGFYEDQHRQKHTEDGDAKAATNSWWAARLRTQATILRAAIAAVPMEGESNGG